MYFDNATCGAYKVSVNGGHCTITKAGKVVFHRGRDFLTGNLLPDWYDSKHKPIVEALIALDKAILAVEQ